MVNENVSERLPITDAEANLLKPVIAELLQTIPEIWEEFALNALTFLQNNALFLLTAAGLVERRGWVRCEMVGHQTYVEEKFQATGEGGLAKALEYSTAAMYEVWGESYCEWHNGERGSVSPFHAESLKPDEWRLTAEGVLGRDDLNGENSDGTPDFVFDFVLKRGFYGPGHWFRIMANPVLRSKYEKEIKELTIAGQDFYSLPRPPVLGDGHLLEFGRSKNPLARKRST